MLGKLLLRRSFEKDFRYSWESPNRATKSSIIKWGPFNSNWCQFVIQEYFTLDQLLATQVPFIELVARREPSLKVPDQTDLNQISASKSYLKWFVSKLLKSFFVTNVELDQSLKTFCRLNCCLCGHASFDHGNLMPTFNATAWNFLKF